MNTGVQKSGATPWGARTSTSAAASVPPSGYPRRTCCALPQQHGIPYAATASVGHPADFIRKIQKAAATEGPAFLHVYAPCPTGWGCGSDSTIRLGKSVVDTGLWPLVEWDHGTVRITRSLAKFDPLQTYLSEQTRFRNLNEVDIQAMALARDESWRQLLAWERETQNPCATEIM